jgi:glycine cleavage system H protein
MSNTPDDLKYVSSHEWVKSEEGDVVSVGISDFAQEQLGDIVFIELPNLGRVVNAGESCAVVESVKAASDIYSPVSGEIVEVNAALSDSPEWVNEDSYANWLFRVRLSDPQELDTLLTADQYSALNNL